MVNVATMDLNLLRVLGELLRERNVTRAAAQLGLSQAATSHALARLRKSFGDPLLVRSGQSLQLTPEAERLVPIVEDILRLVNTSLSAPEFDPSTATTTFTVAMPDFLNSMIAPELAVVVREQAPKVVLHVLGTPVRSDARRDGTLDAIAMPAQRVAPGHPSLRLGSVSWTGIAAVGRPGLDEGITPADYAAMPHISFPRALVEVLIDEKLADAGLRRTIAVTVNNSDLVPSMIPGSELVSVGWDGFDKPGVRTFDLPVDIPDFDYHIAWSRRLANDPASVWLRRQIVDIASRRLAQ
ncbi:LysR family transcriptional regulator [Tsukamurella sp. 1534]|uniref:LysR family transcriptional regulator n=1 Tax=Tsukamurella sp. 1534 TaxID=1151061 RepID=UPI00131EEF68|nr:LysR family transcriptional regulator [Tsukamurella sp. 1534]